jgi:UDP-N-acetylmuramoyl-tripeptide--D-alanyl-D-alanine ligase
VTGLDAAAACSATSRPRADDREFAGVSTDSRSIRPRDLFVALTGDRFDGHDYVDSAIAGGATGVVCLRGRSGDRRDVLFLEVDDTLRAFGDLAAWNRGRFDVPVVAVTGSNGKTSTKEMLRSVLATAYGDDAVLANKGNLNNLIGMPTTLLELAEHHRVAVLEMGMNAPGEIARLTEIASPTLGLVTCVGSAHLEGLGSIEGVAAAKGELFAGLPAGATALVNLDDARVVEQAARFSGRHVGYGEQGQTMACEIEALGLMGSRFVLVHGDERCAVEIKAVGLHNVANALAAAAVGVELGLGLAEVAEGLGSAPVPGMRMQPRLLANGVTVVDDCYNANPASLEVALQTIGDAAGQGRCLLALGDMLELGSETDRLHEVAGRAAADLAPALLCVVGANAKALVGGALAAGLAADRVAICADHAEVAASVARCWRAGDVVLVKGSRGSAMDRVVAELEQLGGRQ